MTESKKELPNKEVKFIKRVFTVPVARNEEIRALMKEMEIDNFKDLLNVSLSIVDWMIRQRKAGRTVGSYDLKTGRAWELYSKELELAVTRQDYDWSEIIIDLSDIKDEDLE